MGKFHDIAGTLVNEGGEPVAGVSELVGAYDEDFGISDAKIAELTLNLELANTEIGKLKSHMYDLMNAAPAPVDEPVTDENEPTDEDDADLDDFFAEDEDNK